MLEQVSYLYYYRNMSQQEIARYLHLSKMNVSRLLQKAKDAGIVHTTITLPFEIDKRLASNLEKKYGLQQATVVKTDGSMTSNELNEFLGKVAAFYFTTSFPNNKTYGMGVGETIGKLVAHIPPIYTEKVHVIQLMGGVSAVSVGNPFSIIQSMCEKLGAEGNYLSSYALVKDETLRNNTFVNLEENGFLDLWGNCDEVYLGIGSIKSENYFLDTLIHDEGAKAAKDSEIAGDLLGHCFNINGKFLQTAIENKLVSIPIDLLASIKKRVAIAGGKEKIEAIAGALKTGLITHLLTDDKTASSILHLT